MDRLSRIRERLAQAGLDAALITDEKNQRYATGFAFTDGAVVVTRESAFLITDSRYTEAAQKTVAEDIAVLRFGAGKSLAERVREVLSECAVQRLGAEEGSLPHGAYLAWEESLGMSLLPCQSVFNELRAAKDEDELASMRVAQSIAESALEDVLGIIRPGVTERDIAAEITYRLLKHGGEGNSFDPIAVTGANSSMPHGVPSDVPVKAGDFVTMDFGCIYDGYCSDMTRTVAVGHVTDEMQTVYDTVLNAQLAGIAACKAGVTGRDVDAAGRKIIEAAGYGDAFGHGFGHGVGLEIHEAPVASPRGEAPLPAGSIVTAEPGIYLPGRFGVRIEDMLYVIEDGCIDLTDAPKQLIVL